MFCRIEGWILTTLSFVCAEYPRLAKKNMEGNQVLDIRVSAGAGDITRVSFEISNACMLNHIVEGMDGYICIYLIFIYIYIYILVTYLNSYHWLVYVRAYTYIVSAQWTIHTYMSTQIYVYVLVHGLCIPTSLAHICTFKKHKYGWVFLLSASVGFELPTDPTSVALRQVTCSIAPHVPDWKQTGRLLAVLGRAVEQLRWSKFLLGSSSLLCMHKADYLPCAYIYIV